MSASSVFIWYLHLVSLVYRNEAQSGYGEIQWEKLASGEGDRVMKDLRSLPHEHQIEGQGAYWACEK